MKVYLNSEIDKSYFALFLLLLIANFSISCNNTQNDKIQKSPDEVVSEDTIQEMILTEDSLKDLSADDLMYMRNEIFARHGYTFKNTDLAEYFAKFDWYEPEFANVDSLLTAIDQQNVDLILEFEEKLKHSDSSFEEFLSLFPDVSEKEYFLNKDRNLGDLTLIDDRDVEKYFNLDIVEIYEGCQNYTMYAVACFYLPDCECVALITNQSTCPIANIYWEFPMYVFDMDGNLKTEYSLAFDRGDSEDFTHAEVVIKDGKITKNITHRWSIWNEEEGNPNEYSESYILKVHFDPNTNKFVEVKL